MTSAMSRMARRSRARFAASLARLAFGLWIAWTAGPGLPAHAATPQTRIVDLNLYQQQDLRAFAMGNAFSPVARGEAALQYNPAGLAQYDLDFKADYSISLMEAPGNFINDTLKVSSGSPTPQDVVNYLEKYAGTTHDYVLQTFPSVVLNLGDFNFGLGAGNLEVQRYSLQFVNGGGTLLPGTTLQSNDSLAASVDKARIALGGAAVQLFSGKALLGITAKNVTYSESSANLSFANLIAPGAGKIDLSPTSTDYGTTTAYDAGLIYRMEILPALRPQWSVTGYNIGGYTLKGTSPAGVTQTVRVADTYNLGFALQPDLGFVHIVISAEAEDVGGAIKVQDASGVNHARAQDQLYHAGIEIGVIKTPTGNNVISLRAGSNGGYSTFGAELNLWGFLRAVYTNGTDNLGYQGHPNLFRFEAYQVALGIAF